MKSMTPAAGDDISGPPMTRSEALKARRGAVSSANEIARLAIALQDSELERTGIFLPTAQAVARVSAASSESMPAALSAKPGQYAIAALGLHGHTVDC